MKFLNPAGLWLLLGVPVLILIYLIRPHHEERAVSSTFMWKLSQKFMKRQLPMQRLQRFLLFAIQLLLLICAALMIARPALITGKSTEYIAIIDASASMQTKDANGVSRFDRAVEQAKALADNIAHGHRVSVILAGDNAHYLIQSSDAPGKVRLALDSTSCESGGCNTEKALTLAQQLCNRGKSQVIFYTDAPCERASNIQVVDLNEGAWNVSIDNVTTYAEEDSGTFAAATITSHNRDATITVGLKVNGVLKTAKTVSLIRNEPQELHLPTEDADYGGIFEVFVDEDDGLALDNSYSLCTGYSRTYNIFLASKTPFYLQNVLLSLDSCSVTAVDNLDTGVPTGYDLYVFDGLFPETYPTDGSVLQFGTGNLPDGLDPEKTITIPAKLTKLPGSHELYDDLSLLDTTVSQYTVLTGSAQWEKVLTCAKSPVCMTRVNDLGLRTTVFSFDLHQSNLPMQTDYVVLMKNIVEKSVFDLIPDSKFPVGSTVELAVLPNAQQMYMELPDGSIKTLTPNAGQCSVALDTVGVHTAVVSTAAGGEFADFFVHIPEGEVSCPVHEPMSVTLTEGSSDAPDAITELWIWLALAMLVLLIVEWGVYFREQY